MINVNLVLAAKSIFHIPRKCTLHVKQGGRGPWDPHSALSRNRINSVLLCSPQIAQMGPNQTATFTFTARSAVWAFFFFFFSPASSNTKESKEKKVPSFHCEHRWVNAAGSLSMKSWKPDIFLIKTLPKPLKKEASNRKWWPGKANDGCLHHQPTETVVCFQAEGRLFTTAGQSWGFYHDEPKLSLSFELNW